MYLAFPDYENGNIIISSGRSSLVTFFTKQQVLSFIKSWPVFKKWPRVNGLAQLIIRVILLLRLENLLVYFMPAYYVVARKETDR